MQSSYRVSSLEHDADPAWEDDRQMSRPIDVPCGRN